MRRLRGVQPEQPDNFEINTQDSVKEQLDRRNLGEEVLVYRVPSEKSTVVTVGSWLANPEGRKEALALRDLLRGLKDAAGGTPFAGADFWRMKK